ncbi:unnamed protein product [Moneuplotes crassus]|uniref:Spt4/RpoE2 zinc finger domain-containing protein n=1 Tax=Euplotes crassus TaxID=5936 RepID=A0AAD1Y734_EUPCR|nr:unnamed protein product [Moneuplotes crassus]
MEISQESATLPDSVKKLRACKICRLVKSASQFQGQGCDNCKIGKQTFEFKKFTTPKFSGMISLMDPTFSFAARYNKLNLIPGVYAIEVEGVQEEEIYQE